MDGGGLLDGAFELTCCGVAFDSLFCFVCRGSKVQCQRAQVVCGCVGVRVWECGCRPASMQARHAHTSRCVYACVLVFVYVYLWVRVCGCTRVYICLFVSRYVSICVYVQVHVFVHVLCVCVCSRARALTCIFHTNPHPHTHTNAHNRSCTLISLYSCRLVSPLA